MTFKGFIAGITPPILSHARGKERRNNAIDFSGAYPDWESALQQCDGYDADVILQRVRSSTAKVIRGEAAYERDGCCFPNHEYVYPLVSSLIICAAENRGRLSVIDFGGSLGSTYFQNRPFLERLPDVSWAVVEQPHFVALGKQELQHTPLLFFETLEEAAAANRPNLLLLSAVLGWIPSPYEMLERSLRLQIGHVVIDRTLIRTGDEDRLTVQRVPAYIYGKDVSYPAWIFSHARLLEALTREYHLLHEFEALGGAVSADGEPASYRGWHLVRK